MRVFLAHLKLDSSIVYWILASLNSWKGYFSSYYYAWIAQVDPYAHL